MGIVRFALRFPYTFYVLAALILFLGIVAMRDPVVRDIVGGFIAFILEVAIFTGLMTLAGYVAFGVGGALTLGVTGLTVSFVVVGILGTVSALREPGMTLE